MSAYSTLYITREDAIRLIVESLFKASDDRLEELAFEAWGRDRLYNFLTVSFYDKEDNDMNFRRVNAGGAGE